MGNEATCQHDRLQELTISKPEFKEGLYTFQIGTVKCLDCGKESTAYRYTSFGPGLPLIITSDKWRFVNQMTCKHSSTEIRDIKECAKSGGADRQFARMFLGPFFNGIQNVGYLIGTEACLLCGKTWSVENDEYKKVWKDMRKEIVVIGKWKRM